MTRAHTGDRDEDPGPVDLLAIRRTNELIEAVTERRLAHPGPPLARAYETEDAAIQLLQALTADVDRDAPPLCPPASRPWTRTGRAAGARRRGSRRRRRAHTLIALSVTATVFTTTGVAAAGGMMARTDREAEPKKNSGLIERSESPRRDPMNIPRRGYDHADGRLTGKEPGSGVDGRQRSAYRPQPAGSAVPSVRPLRTKEPQSRAGQRDRQDSLERGDVDIGLDPQEPQLP